MADAQVHVPRMAVYYPYIHFRDDRWLKVAALYWPRMVRLVGVDYPTRDSELVTILRNELDFVVNIPPTTAAEKVVGEFTHVVENLGRWEREDWTLPSDAAERGFLEASAPTPPRWLEAAGGIQNISNHALVRRMHAYLDGFAAVHRSEVAPKLASLLIDARLAAPLRAAAEADEPRAGDGDWLAMHPELAWVYKCRLTDMVAQLNNLVATTDQLPAHAAIDGALVIDRRPFRDAGGLPSVPSVASAFGLMAVEAVVPQGLSRVPAEKIVKIRRRYGHQSDRWRQYVDGVGADLADQLQNVESPDILDAYLQDAVRRYSAAPVADLRRALTDVGVDGVKRAVNSKFELPAALAATGLLATQPHLAVAAGVALGAVSIRRETRAKAQAAQANPAAYLFDIQQALAPQTWVTRVIAALRQASGLAG